jgi:manganese oxidase
MTQMGHTFGNLIGVDTAGLNEKMRPLVPGFAAMGDTGMGEMGEMSMDVPPNSLPMAGGRGPFGAITMGGMFTMLKVRERLEGNRDPGWYRSPPESQADVASPADLKRDGIEL